MWKYNLPVSCPIEGYTEPNGEVFYRFVKSSPATEDDFLPYIQLYPDRYKKCKDYRKQCQAYGLSVLKSTERTSIFPHYSNFVAKLVLKRQHGVMKHTPSTNNPDHYTVWEYKDGNILSSVVTVEKVD